MVNAALESSPTSDHFDMNGNFSEDDIQHLLGVMNATHEDTAQGVPNPVMQAAVETAACLAPSENSHHNTTSSNIQNETIHEEAKALARSERKRSREKQRRLDVNKQFTDLTKLVAQIEQEEREEDPTVFRQSFSATNRADLIARAISHMERLRDVNKRRKLENATLQQQLQESQKAGEDIAAKYKEALCKNNGMMMMPQANKPVSLVLLFASHCFDLVLHVYISTGTLDTNLLTFLYISGHDDGSHDDAFEHSPRHAAVWNARYGCHEPIHDATGIHATTRCCSYGCCCATTTTTAAATTTTTTTAFSSTLSSTTTTTTASATTAFSSTTTTTTATSTTATATTATSPTSAGSHHDDTPANDVYIDAKCLSHHDGSKQCCYYDGTSTHALLCRCRTRGSLCRAQDRRCRHATATITTAATLQWTRQLVVLCGR